tara:strand:+ start:245 stop:625 length:381 start_codon:yes stop_codon:yes gene_type:complete
MNSLLKIMLVAFFILLCIIAIVRDSDAGDDILYNKIVPSERNVDGQHCLVKQIIRQKGDTIIKEEILECSDGRKRMDGPSYWQLFAEFYYRDVSAPEYCRYYSRNNHAFKMHGKTCLKSNGRWEIK